LVELLREAPDRSIRVEVVSPDISSSPEWWLEKTRRKAPWERVMPQGETEEPPKNGGLDADAVRLSREYSLTDRIGCGGMGEVWRAVQRSLDRVVAVKKLVPQNGESSTDNDLRFHQEALTAAQLDHPSIVPTYDLALDGSGRPIMSMKLLRGVPWIDLIARERPLLTYDDFLQRHLGILMDIAEAVAFAHSRGIVHRDLKPHNVVVGEFGEVYLVDWGLAVVFSRERLEEATGHRPQKPLPSPQTAPSPAGTYTYMAPEQADETALRVGPATDVFLLGATLYHVLAGQAPRAQVTPSQLQRMATQGEYRPLRETAWGGAAPHDLVLLVEESMRPAAGERISSALEFHRHLKDYLTGAGARRESTRLTEAAAQVLAAASIGYHEYGDVLAKLGRATTLWPGNQAARQIRDEALLQHGSEALRHGDLLLARVQTEGVENEGRRRALLGEIEQAQRIQGRRERLRRGAFAATLALMIVVALGTAWFNRQLSARTAAAERAQVQEAAARAGAEEASLQARRAEQQVALSNESLAQELYRNQVELAGRHIDAAQPVTARPLLRDASPQLRAEEWELLWSRAHSTVAEWHVPGGPFRAMARGEGGNRSLVLVASDGTLRRVDLETLRDTPITASDVGHVTAAWLRSGGTVCLVGSDDGRVHQLDLEAPEAPPVLLANVGEPVLHVTMAEKDSLLAVATDEEGLIVVDTGTGRTLWGGRFRLAVDSHLTFSPDGSLLATSMHDLTVELRDASTGQLCRKLYGHIGNICALNFSADGERMLTASYDTSARIWDLANEKAHLSIEVTREVESRGHVLHALWLESQNLVATASADYRAALWETTTGARKSELLAHEQEILGFTSMDEGRLLLSAGSNGHLVIWNAEHPDGRVSLEGHKGKTVCRGFALGGRYAVTAAHDSSVRLWEPDTGREALRIQLPLGGYGYSEAALNNDGRYLATVNSPESALRVYDLEGPSKVLDVPLEGRLDAVAISGSAHRMAVTGVGGVSVLVIRGAHDWEPSLVRLDAPAADGYCAEFSPDEATLAIGFGDGSVRLYDSTTGTLASTFTGFTPRPVTIAFSRDGERMAVGCFDGNVRIRDRQTGRVDSITTHESYVCDFEFLPSGRRWASSGGDGKITVHDDATGKLYLSIDAKGREFYSLSMSPDGRYLAVSTRDRGPEIWPLHDQAWLPSKDSDTARAALTKCRDATERAQQGSLECRARFLAASKAPDASFVRALLADIAAVAGADGPSPRFDWMVASPGRIEAIVLQEPETLRRTLEGIADDLRGMPLRRVADADTVPDLSPAEFAPYVPARLRPTRVATGSIDETRMLRILVLIDRDDPPRKVHLAGNRLELASWIPNFLPLRYIGQADSGGHIWELALGYRPMEFKLTYGVWGEPWVTSHEWEGHPNRHIDSMTLLHADDYGVLYYLARFGQQPH